MRFLLLLTLLSACSDVTGSDEIKLGRRRGDAGPAVIIVDKSERSALSETAEKEPNEDGQAIPVPGAVRGRLDKAGDRDLYKVTLPVAGTLKVSLSAVDDADLVLEVRQPGGELIAACDNGPAKVAEGIPNLFVQPGPLVIEVREARAPAKPSKAKPKKGAPPPPPPAPSRTGPSQPYLLEVRLLPPSAPGEEREPNDQSAFADDLAMGATGRGIIGWRRDTDTWRVPLEGVREDEGLSVDVEGVEGVSLKVSLVDGAGATLVERKGKTGASVSLRSVSVPGGKEGEGKGTTLFVVVTGDRPSDESYTVRAQAAALVLDEESEPNDSPASASPLADVPGATSGTRVGTLAAGDVDCFRLDPADGARSLDVIFSPPASVDGSLALVAEDGSPMAAPVDAAKKGGPERLTVTVPSGKPAIIKLVGKVGEAGERYKLRWTVAEAAAPVPGVDDQ